MSHRRGRALHSVAAVALAFAGACGGGGGSGKPDKATLVNQLKKSLPAPLAKCVADGIYGRFSDSKLNDLAQARQLSQADQQTVIEIGQECAAKNQGSFGSVPTLPSTSGPSTSAPPSPEPSTSAPATSVP